MQLENRQLKKNMVTGLWELKKTIHSKHRSWKSSQLRGESASASEVAQSYPTLWDPVDCSPPGSSVHGILQARILEWVVISFSNYWFISFVCFLTYWPLPSPNKVYGPGEREVSLTYGTLYPKSLNLWPVERTQWILVEWKKSSKWLSPPLPMH